jgi:hypothetical protein
MTESEWEAVLLKRFGNESERVTTGRALIGWRPYETAPEPITAPHQDTVTTVRVPKLITQTEAHAAMPDVLVFDDPHDPPIVGMSREDVEHRKAFARFAPPEPTPKKPWYCRWGLHGRWIGLGRKSVVHPPLGPFDPRNEADRTFSADFKICADCGLEREYDNDPF